MMLEFMVPDPHAQLVFTRNWPPNLDTRMYANSMLTPNMFIS